MFGCDKHRINLVIPDSSIWPSCTLWSLFTRAVKAYQDREFLVFEDGTRLSYLDVYHEALSFAASLRHMGIKKGTHVAVKLKNSPEAVIVALAIQSLGAVRVPMNITWGPMEMNYALSKTDAEYLISDVEESFINPTTPPSLKTVVVIGEEGMQGFEFQKRFKNWNAFKEFVSCENAEGVNVLDLDSLVQDVSCTEVSDIFFTSGSSGNPKGVPLTHDMLLRNAYAGCVNRNFNDGRRIYLPIPQCHIYAYVEGLLAALFVGGTLLMTRNNLKPEEALDYLMKEEAQDLIMVPSQAIKYVEYLRDSTIKPSCVQSIYCSASSTPKWLWSALRETFGIEDVITGYGMTEVSGATMQTRSFDSDSTLMQCVGTYMNAGIAGDKTLQGRLIEYKVVDIETKGTLPQGEIGELWCRGPVVMKGYCNDSEVNSRAFSDGWLRTGDLGRFDERGYLELCGRLGDSYKINGENVSTRFVASILEECPGVECVEIVGVPNARLGAVGAAFVQLEEDHPRRRDEFEQFCKKNLARYQVPKYYFYFKDTDWPRTESGKVKKKELVLYASLCA